MELVVGICWRLLLVNAYSVSQLYKRRTDAQRQIIIIPFDSREKTFSTDINKPNEGTTDEEKGERGNERQ